MNSHAGAFNITGASLPAAPPRPKPLAAHARRRQPPSFDDLAAALNSGGFFQERDLRIATGDVTTAIRRVANVARSFSLSAV